LLHDLFRRKLRGLQPHGLDSIKQLANFVHCDVQRYGQLPREALHARLLRFAKNQKQDGERL
jgi:hypothetical protein